ncbi:unnamed protein product [Caenorhabditis angaria]|uniref:ZP domain-containing protein n=1 Tax=Caenorhabditis angaria TaxID=860376 RepID=A0A9P1IYR1_9PELO|nr:unnamed protein product [Caenorhabditis angaria]
MKNARVLGSPRLTCSKKSIIFSFESNIPFQGRISVINKLFIPECNEDYSSNIQKNATFHLDISKCADPNFLRNGSRVLRAHVEIGFHPLVITNSDRIFLLECMDNQPSHVVNMASDSANCTHLVRMASKWDSMTEFHVGDSIVHEWSCKLPHKELGKTQTYITNCNAFSQNGQIIHLIDENGCIIDSELMGDVVYNNYMPKLYARAKIFKLLTDEKYRIECTFEFCHKDSPCHERAFPPKCAFTKEEILKRFTSGAEADHSSAMMPGNPNIGYDRKVKISTAWLTVRYNQYTTIENLHERYHLRTVLNPGLVEENKALNHFLMGISYREPMKSSSASDIPVSVQISEVTPISNRFETNRIEAARILHPSAFQPVLNPPVIQDSNEEFIESITMGSNKIDERFKNKPAVAVPIANNRISDEIAADNKNNINKTIASTTIPPVTLTQLPPATSQPTATPITSASILTKPPTIKTESPIERTKTLPTTTTFVPTIMRKIPTSTTRIDINQQREKFKNANVENSLRISNNQKPTESSSTKPAPARLHFYTDIKTKKITPTTPYSSPVLPTTTEKPGSELPFKVAGNADVFARKPYDKFVNNNADWRLDERAINDSDVIPERQTSAACNNATIISSQQQCKWSGVEHLLLIWSFASLIVWMVMIAVCFYRHSNRKPRWMAFREQELRRAAQSRVLGQEHPWLHADAFEERNRTKNEIEINKF